MNAISGVPVLAVLGQFIVLHVLFLMFSLRSPDARRKRTCFDLNQVIADQARSVFNPEPSHPSKSENFDTSSPPRLIPEKALSWRIMAPRATLVWLCLLFWVAGTERLDGRYGSELKVPERLDLVSFY